MSTFNGIIEGISRVDEGNYIEIRLDSLTLG
jgi:hypothetical protein